jgi:diaminopimelate epimerase
MRIYNSDSSEPEMCGNGIRCMAKFVADLEGVAGTEKSYNIHTLAGTIIPKMLPDGQVCVDMGFPELNGPKVPTTLAVNSKGIAQDAPIVVDGKTWKATCVSMGNPHAVVFVPDLEAFDFDKVGPLFEKHEAFPKKVNTEFVQVISKTHLKMKVWERGAGPTLACGTGACALLIAAVLCGHAQRRATVTLPGGDLIIEWRESDGRVFMTGPAALAFSGETPLNANSRKRKGSPQ